MRVRPQNCDREGQAETQEGEVGVQAWEEECREAGSRGGKTVQGLREACVPQK